MKDEIENYRPREPRVESIDGHTLVAWTGEERGASTETLWIGNIPARIERSLKGNRVVATVFDPSPIRAGDSVRVSQQVAAFPAPRTGRTALGDLAFDPGSGSPRAEGLSGEGPLTSGFELLDDALPLVRSGVNVIFDSSDDPATFDRLIAALDLDPLVVATPRDVGFDASHAVTWENEGSLRLALRVATNWTSRVARSSLVFESQPLDLDTLTSGLADRTIIARFVLPDGLAVIAETLEVGTADCQVFLRDDGTIDLSRSHSRLAGDSDWAELAARAAEVRETIQIFGEEDVSDEDREVVDRVDRVERALKSA